MKAARSPLTQLGRPGALVLLVAACVALGLLSLKINGLLILGGLVGLAAAALLISYPFACVPIYYILLYTRPAETFPFLAKFRLIMLLVGLMGSAFVLKVLVFRNTKIIRNGQIVFLIGILAAIALSLPGSYYRTVSLERFFDMARVLVMVFLVAHIVDNYRKFLGVVWTILLSLTFLSCINFVLWISGQKVVPNGGSGGMGGGFLGDGNDFALALNTMLPLAIFQVFSAKRRRVRLLAAFVTLSFLASIVATYSRGGLLGSIAVFAMAYWFVLLRSRNWLKGMVVVLVFSLIGAVVLVTLTPESFTERMSGMTEISEDESALGRLDAWGAGMKMIRDQPFFGVGAGAFSDAYGTRYKPFDAVSANWREAHSLYVQAPAELGLVGAFFVFGLFALMYRHQRRIKLFGLSDPQRQKEVHFFADALTTGLVGFMVSGAFLSVTYYPNLYILSTLTIILMKLAAEDAEGIGSPHES